MKALNVAVRETPVGLVAVLPPGWATSVTHRPDGVSVTYGNVWPSDVLGVVTKCERCEGTGAHDDNGWRGDCPYWLAGCNANNGTTTCSYGCVDEPECMTCEPSEGWGDDPGPTCYGCDGTGYAPLKFVKVLAVWPIVTMSTACSDDAPSFPFAIVRSPAGGQEVVAGWPDHQHETRVNLPDAEPGGVALHVEWTDCPTCDGRMLTQHPTPEHPWHEFCPTCQTPFVPPSDAPLVEVAP